MTGMYVLASTTPAGATAGATAAGAVVAAGLGPAGAAVGGAGAAAGAQATTTAARDRLETMVKSLVGTMPVSFPFPWVASPSPWQRQDDSANSTRIISARQLPSGGLPRGLAPARDIQVDRHNHDGARDNRLPFLGYREDAQPVGQGTDDERADDGAHDAAFTAAQRRAANDRGGDGVKLVTLAQRRLGRVEPRGDQHAPQPAEDAAEGVDGDLPVDDVDAREARRLLVAAERKHVPAEHGACQDHAGDDGRAEQHQHRVGDLEQRDARAD